ncbi:hypothetical protein LTS18_000721, partial [Coniosporium uncinatum]
AIDDALNAYHTATKAAFVLYCMGIGFALILMLFSIIALFTATRLMGIAGFVLALLAFICLGIASGIGTAIGVKGSKEINRYENDIGVSAYRGGKFLALTWAATG